MEKKKIDFFVGRRNEEIKAFAKEKGFEEIFFVKEIKSIFDFEKKDKEFFDACLIKTRNLDFLRRMVDKARNYFDDILVLGTTDIINRRALEHTKVSALVSPEFSRSEDFLYQRNSGLNHVLCRIANENKKMIIFRMKDFSGTKENKASFFGKLIQNLKLCRKYKVNYLLTNFSSKKDEILHAKQLTSLEQILCS
ncbi:MAG: hypothetical protein NZ889_01985, partial [Candidatus Pacearchaeota archaeon]|nr:hypothetical protein [Candidatus Pacearchaeota archaeon]